MHRTGMHFTVLGAAERKTRLCGLYGCERVSKRAKSTSYGTSGRGLLQRALVL